MLMLNMITIVVKIIIIMSKPVYWKSDSSISNNRNEGNNDNDNDLK